MGNDESFVDVIRFDNLLIKASIEITPEHPKEVALVVRQLLADAQTRHGRRGDRVLG